MKTANVVALSRTPLYRGMEKQAEWEEDASRASVNT